ncbi:hypothetical protein [Sphingomonas cavernae]|uniref:Uncharacterized protein n=1 Tax=Sphingomonas cavernae TaxID=2320861 RepID=A0A418WPS0_9SPHN|nr:hypothetical protein [Sphingomonas cavernae]RJF93223.1 hypothetical protein D3876_02370 [Sphingomonas cavernae]
MKQVVKRRARIARVRRAQHLQASAHAQMAENRVMTLESQAGHLIRLASDLDATPGDATGAALANAGELAQRLRAARDGLTDAIVGARATALERAARRMEARIKQESAERLDQRARTALAEYLERKGNVPVRRRPRLDGGDA